jgi:hypothetical protein
MKKLSNSKKTYKQPISENKNSQRAPTNKKRKKRKLLLGDDSHPNNDVGCYNIVAGARVHCRYLPN